MTNPCKRGGAPGRAQSEDSRSGSFKHGHEKLGGRKRGTPNFFSIDYKRAILEAAYRIGHDGNGKNGVVGYFTWVADHHPRIFAGVLLISLLPIEYAESNMPEPPRRTVEELDTSRFATTSGSQARTALRDNLSHRGPGPARTFRLAVLYN